MLCPNCDMPVEVDAAFCGLCGRPLPPVHLRKAASVRDSHTYLGQLTADRKEAAVHKGATVSPGSDFIPAFLLTPVPESYEPLSEPPVHEPFSSRAPVTSSSLRSAKPARVRNYVSSIDRGRYLIFIAIILLLIGLAIFSVVFALAQHL